MQVVGWRGPRFSIFFDQQAIRTKCARGRKQYSNVWKIISTFVLRVPRENIMKMTVEEHINNKGYELIIRKRRKKS